MFLDNLDKQQFHGIISARSWTGWFLEPVLRNLCPYRDKPAEFAGESGTSCSTVPARQETVVVIDSQLLASFRIHPGSPARQTSEDTSVILFAQPEIIEAGRSNMRYLAQEQISIACCQDGFLYIHHRLLRPDQRLRAVLDDAVEITMRPWGARDL
jgi:hypothetical protein